MDWNLATKEEKEKYLNSLKDKWIYESPDNGNTIYRRRFFAKEREQITDIQREELTRVRTCN